MSTLPTLRPDATRRGGFTLLELIVVITIIGLLASIVMVSTRGAGPKARLTKAKAEMRNIYSVAEAMYNETGRWPESIEDMVNAKDDNDMPLSMSLDKYPTDPWQNEYVYTVENNLAIVRCLGSDGAEGGEGEAQDLSYPETDDEF
jgi:general secretion pathway protein G